jgi:hypothetical protein
VSRFDKTPRGITRVYKRSSTDVPETKNAPAPQAKLATRNRDMRSSLRLTNAKQLSGLAWSKGPGARRTLSRSPRAGVEARATVS